MRPTGTCPDCGRPITLQPSGWWAHDHAVNPEDCWRVSMDGPADNNNEHEDN